MSGGASASLKRPETTGVFAATRLRMILKIFSLSPPGRNFCNKVNRVPYKVLSAVGNFK